MLPWPRRDSPCNAPAGASLKGSREGPGGVRTLYWACWGRPEGEPGETGQGGRKGRGRTCCATARLFSSLASSAAAAFVSRLLGAAFPRHMRPPLGLPPPPVMVPDSLIVSPCHAPGLSCLARGGCERNHEALQCSDCSAELRSCVSRAKMPDAYYGHCMQHSNNNLSGSPACGSRSPVAERPLQL